MTSRDLQQSLTDLQVTALEKLAQREGIPTGRQELVRLIEKGGIAYAQAEIWRYKPPPQPQPEGIRAQPAPQISFFKRLSQRWFGRGRSGY